VNVRLGSNSVELPLGAVLDLAARLRAQGLMTTADRLRSKGTFTEREKPRVLAVLNHWLDTEGKASFPESLFALRDELMRDLKRPPFDQ
jgi:hypothetical protein